MLKLDACVRHRDSQTASESSGLEVMKRCLNLKEIYLRFRSDAVGWMDWAKAIVQVDKMEKVVVKGHEGTDGSASQESMHLLQVFVEVVNMDGPSVAGLSTNPCPRPSFCMLNHLDLELPHPVTGELIKLLLLGLRQLTKLRLHLKYSLSVMDMLGQHDISYRESSDLSNPLNLEPTHPYLQSLNVTIDVLVLLLSFTHAYSAASRCSRPFEFLTDMLYIISLFKES
ncbi:hypothetical protein BC829DRAFT_260149 [Chytridium lagenaria]|nr:hypothetical protein BC829DRAFT_260149 [Chytridium lagenaria]